MPALLAIFERIRLLNLEGTPVIVAGTAKRRRFPAARGLVLGSLAAVVASVLLIPRISFEYRFGELDPTYPEWVAVNSKVAEGFSTRGRRNPAYVVVDEPDEVPAVMAALHAKIAQDTTQRIVGADTFTTTILSVESLQERFPLDTQTQQRKLSRIAGVRARLSDPFIEAEQSADLDKLRRSASTLAPIPLDSVPDFLKKQFTSKTGELGGFIVIYPAVGLSDGRLSMAFADDVGTIVTESGRTHHASSTSIVAADMLRLMQHEAPLMVLATFVIVALLMWANFGRVRWALLALLPLAVGVLWMLLLMEVFAMRLNFYNLVVLPAVLGIGNDAGAHLVHRYREEGAGSILAVLRSTGEHVTMGAVTTMIGFAGLLLSFHPGLNTIGELAVVGIGTTLVAALAFLPALLQWLEDRQAKPDAVPVPTVETQG
jgi:predicted RND superfamily exporter protein